MAATAVVRLSQLSELLLLHIYVSDCASQECINEKGHNAISQKVSI